MPDLGGLARRVLPPGLKDRVREPYARLGLAYRNRRYAPLDADGLAAALRDLGVRDGATVMVHVSMNELRIAAPSVKAGALLELLIELVGERGTLLVPTFPFSGSQELYAREHPVYDVRRTPSRTGLVTEIFRRRRDAIRSLHPTHPVAARGPGAAWLLEAHHQGTTFGLDSPFCRLREVGGIVVGIGVRMDRGYSVLHAAEELQPAARAYAFASDTIAMTIRAGARELPYDLVPLRGGLDRDLRGVERRLVGAGQLRFERPSGLVLGAGSAAGIIDGCISALDDDVFYRGSPLRAVSVGA